MWREVVVGAEDAVRCAYVHREGSSLLSAAGPYLAASLSTLTLDAHIAAHISLVP